MTGSYVVERCGSTAIECGGVVLLYAVAVFEGEGHEKEYRYVFYMEIAQNSLICQITKNHLKNSFTQRHASRLSM